MTTPDLGPVGLWTFTLDLRPADEVRDLVPEIEAMGWGCVWVPEAVNRDAMVNSALLLSASSTIAMHSPRSSIGAGAASRANCATRWRRGSRSRVRPSRR